MASDQELEDINNWFTYHPPQGDQAERYTRLRECARKFALEIVELCPAGPDRTVALRRLRETVFIANAAIACGET